MGGARSLQSTCCLTNTSFEDRPKFKEAADDNWNVDFKIQIAKKTLWKKVKLLILSNFTFFRNVSWRIFSSMC